jgi:trigger factor
MEIILNDMGACEKNIKVTVPVDIIKKEYEEKIIEVQTKGNIKGFRPGHIPKHVVEKKYGSTILEEMKMTYVTQAFEKAVKDNNLEIFGEPDMHEPPILHKDKEFSFEFILTLKPNFTLPDYKNYKLPTPIVKVEDSEVDMGLNHIRRLKGELIVIKDGEIIKEDSIICDLEIKSNDQSIWEEKNVPLEIRDYPPMKGIEKSAEAIFIGHKENDLCEADIKLSETFPKEEYRNKEAKVFFKILEIKRLKLPELNEEFLQSTGLQSVEALTNEIKKGIQYRKQSEENEKIESQILQKLLDETPMELPKHFIHHRVEHELAKFKDKTSKENLSPEEMATKIQQQETQLTEQMQQQLKELLIINRLAEENNIETTEEEVDQFIKSIAYSLQKWPNEIKAEYEKRGMMEDVKFQVKTHKVLSFIREHAQPVDTNADSSK